MQVDGLRGDIELGKHRILIIDDHPIVRRGLRQLLTDAMACGRCVEAGDAAEAQVIMQEHPPDLALVDLSMEGISGIELIKHLHETRPDVPLLVVSMREETLYAESALAAGASGFVMKHAPDEELISAVNKVVSGGRYLSDTVRERLGRAVMASPSDEAQTPVDQLSDRELDVFTRVGEGYAPRHIADELCISVKTVETHRRNIRRKLGLTSANELSRFAVSWNKDTVAT